MGRGTRDRFTRLSERKRAVRAARKLAPRDGNPDELVSNVAAHRGRPIVMMPMPLPAEAPSGMWVSTETSDYLIYPAETTLTRRTAVICHAEYLATVLVTLLARAKHDEGWSRPGSISARLR